MVIGIIGGGASGMAAAIASAENPDAQIVLMERQARVGRKLSATGNGRCNLTNLHALEGGYHGDSPAFARSALNAFDVQSTLSWFRGLGLYTMTEDSGRVYPYSNQANSVVDVLRFALERPNIRLLTGFEVSRAKKTADGFLVQSGDEAIRCDRLVIACGGLAGARLGGSMAGYQLLRGFGHRVTKLRPALVQLKSEWSGCASLKGVRANCRAAICRDGMEQAESTGELQFTEYGLSGPVIFEISRDACQSAGIWSCRLDFLPELSVNDLREELLHRRSAHWRVEELLTGILHNRLGRVLTRAAGVRLTAEKLRDEDIENVCHAVKHLEVPLTEPMGMDAAQVTAGGMRTTEFNPDTMESRLVPGLYACGEVLDVDGDCGGYNLQWAWSSGRMAGLHAGGIQ